MDPGKIFQIITNSTLLATRLFSENPSDTLQFENRQYCAILSEDAPLASSVVNVKAWHKQGLKLRYSITGGNRDGLFTIDQFTGAISVAAPLDREIQTEHELIVAVESGGEYAHTLVRVAVADVNDNPPEFIDPEPVVTVIEEDDRDLPKVLLKAEATDEDWIDKQGLLYTAAGEGIDGYSAQDAYFSIDPKTGVLSQLRPLDRDPPNGKSIWKIKIKVHDGQFDWSSLRDYSKSQSALQRYFQNRDEGMDSGQKIDDFYRLYERELLTNRFFPASKSSKLTQSQDHTDSLMIARHSGGRKRRKKEHNSKEVFMGQKSDYQLPLISDKAHTNSQAEIGSKIILQDPKISDSFDIVDVSVLNRNITPRTKRSLQMFILNKPNISLNKTFKKHLISDAQQKYKREISERKTKDLLLKNDKCILAYPLLTTGLQHDDGMDEFLDREKCLHSFCNIIDKIPNTLFSPNFTENIFISKKDLNFTNNGLNSSIQYKDQGIQIIKHLEYYCELMKKEIFNYLANNSSQKSLHFALYDNHTHWKSSNSYLIHGVLPLISSKRTDSVGYLQSPKLPTKLKETDRNTKFEIKFSRKNTKYNSQANGGKKVNNKKDNFSNSVNNQFRKNLIRRQSLTLKFPWRANSLKLETDKSRTNKKLSCRNKTQSYHLKDNMNTMQYYSIIKDISLTQRFQSQKYNDSWVGAGKDSKSRFQYGSSEFRYEKTKNEQPKHHYEIDFRYNERGIKTGEREFYPLTLLKFSNYSKNGEMKEFTKWKDSRLSLDVIPNAFENIAQELFFKGMKQHVSNKSSNLVETHDNILVPLLKATKRRSGNESRNGTEVMLRNRIPYFLSSLFRNELNLLPAQAPQNMSAKLDRRIKREIKTKRNKRNENFSPFFVVDKGGCLQFNLKAGRDGRVESKMNNNFYPGREILSIREAQLRHMASQVIRGHSHRRRAKVHVVETIATILVKDINDNAPTFPNMTVYGEVQENGPIDLSVAMIKAWDADDDTSGTNARLTYSIEKNVIDERTGQSLFVVNPRTGELKTALCCLDRETTPEYRLQVVASDGGGLKGTGTVVVRLADVNDNSPIIPRHEWKLMIDETPGNQTPTNSTIMEISVIDPDISNYFFFKIVEYSGWGWDLFGIRTVGSVGELYAKMPMDYENEGHRKGFRLLVNVTDKGRGGWDDPRHTDGAWVSIELRNINDNPPVFRRRIFRVTVREDVPPGTFLATLKASDPDQSDTGLVDYHLLDSWSRFQIDLNGTVKVQLPLDREGPDGSSFVIKVIAVDRGIPPLSSTATLSITLSDVNDCPPRLLLPVVLHIKENLPPQMIGTLFATDDDVWSLGHGPPFNISLGASNREDVRKKVTLKYKKELDSGRGGAEVWTLSELDREENRQLTVDVTMSDAAHLIRTQPIVIVVDDVNDNMMRPGSKTVYLWKTNVSRSDAPLGRIYVDDPDDWDVNDKTFAWEDIPHPFFSLNEKQGTIFASRQAKEGRYELRFLVSDHAWHQKSVKANVTVTVRLLSPEALTHAIPLTLLSATPTSLTNEWSPTSGGGQLGSLTKCIKVVLGDLASNIEVVSVYGSSKGSPSPELYESPYLHSYYDLQRDPYITQYFPVPSATVWISVLDSKGGYINPIKLKGLLQMDLRKLEHLTKLDILTEDSLTHTSTPSTTIISSLSSSIFSPTSQYLPSSPSSISNSSTSVKGMNNFSGSSEDQRQVSAFDPSSAASMASRAPPLQLVDSNRTSLVTPRLTRDAPCPSLKKIFKYSGDLDQCTENSCLNGGRCIPTVKGKKCVCPGNTVGQECKILTRSFSQGSWAWIPPLPNCEGLKISFKFLTRKPNGVLLNSTPLTTLFASTMNPQKTQSQIQRKKQSQSSYFAIQLLEGQVVLFYRGDRGMKQIGTKTNASLANGRWHRVDVIFTKQRMSLITDSTLSLKSFVSSPWSVIWKGDHWWSSSPIQLGGLANRDVGTADSEVNGIVTSSLEGCMSDLRINGKLIDLGEVAFSNGSMPGCQSENSCQHKCGMRGICTAGTHSICSCSLGWTGEACDVKSIPATLKKDSFAKVALSFSPNEFDSVVQLRFRTRKTAASLISLNTEQDKNALAIYVKERHLCFSLMTKTSLHDTKRGEANLRNQIQSGSIQEASTSSTIKIPPKNSGESYTTATSLCIQQEEVSDGAWHLAKGIRHGHTLSLELDDGNLWRTNSSLDSLVDASGGGKDQAEFLMMDVNDRPSGQAAVVIGKTILSDEMANLEPNGSMDFVCIDDVRVSGNPLPLPPAINGSRWGQVTMMAGLEAGCAVPDMCLGVSCVKPFVCRDEWLKASCSCPPSDHFTTDGCQRLEQCLYEPCLNGGKCRQTLNTGYICSCTPQSSGRNCEWTTTKEDNHGLKDSFILLGASLSLIFIFVVLGIILFRICHNRMRKSKRKEGVEEKVSNNSLKERWKKGYSIEKNDNTSVEMTPKFKNPLSLINDFNKSKNSQKTKDNSQNTSRVRKKNSLDEIEISNIYAGLKEHQGVGISTFPYDDLRAYAYEGDESSSGSLGSAISGLRQEFSQELDIKAITLELNEVVDLLKNLPEAERFNLGSRLKKSQYHSCSSLISSKGLTSNQSLIKKQSQHETNQHQFSSEQTISLPKRDFSQGIHPPLAKGANESAISTQTDPKLRCNPLEHKSKEILKDNMIPKDDSISCISKNINYSHVEQGIALPFLSSTKHLTKL